MKDEKAVWVIGIVIVIGLIFILPKLGLFSSAATLPQYQHTQFITNSNGKIVGAVSWSTHNSLPLFAAYQSTVIIDDVSITADDTGATVWDISWTFTNSVYKFNLNYTYGDGKSGSNQVLDTTSYSFSHNYLTSATYHWAFEVRDIDGNWDSAYGSIAFWGEGNLCNFMQGTCKSSCASGETSMPEQNDCASGVCCKSSSGNSCDSNGNWLLGSGKCAGLLAWWCYSDKLVAEQSVSTPPTPTSFPTTYYCPNYDTLTKGGFTVCSGGSCVAGTPSGQTCSQQGGDICSSSETCSPHTWLFATDTDRCCSGTCSPYNGTDGHTRGVITWSQFYSISNEDFKSTDYSCTQTSDCSLKEGYTVTCKTSDSITKAIFDIARTDCDKSLGWWDEIISFALHWGSLGLIPSDLICGSYASAYTQFRDLFVGNGICMADSTTWYGSIWDSVLKTVGSFGIPRSYVLLITIGGIILLLILIFSMFK